MDVTNIQEFYESQNNYILLKKKSLKRSKKNKKMSEKRRYFTKGNHLIEEKITDKITSTGNIILKSINISQEIKKINSYFNSIKNDLEFYKKTIIESELDIKEELTPYEKQILDKYQTNNNLYKGYLNYIDFLKQESEKKHHFYRKKLNILQYKRLKLKKQIYSNLELLKTEEGYVERNKLKRLLIVMNKELDNFKTGVDIVVGDLIVDSTLKQGIVLQIQGDDITVVTDLEQSNTKNVTYKKGEIQKFKSLNNSIYEYQNLLSNNKIFISEKKLLQKKQELNILSQMEEEHLINIDILELNLKTRKISNNSSVIDSDFVLNDANNTLRIKNEKKIELLQELDKMLQSGFSPKHNDFYKIIHEKMQDILSVSASDYNDNYISWIQNFVVDLWKLNVNKRKLQQRLENYVITVPSIINNTPIYRDPLIEEFHTLDNIDLGIQKHQENRATEVTLQVEERENVSVKTLHERVQQMQTQLQQWSEGYKNKDLDTFCSITAHYDWWCFPSTKVTKFDGNSNFKIPTLLDLYDYITQNTPINKTDIESKLQLNTYYRETIELIPEDKLTKGMHYTILYLSLLYLYCESLGIGGEAICTLEQGSNNSEERYSKILRSLNEWLIILEYLNSIDNTIYEELYISLVSYSEFLCGKFLYRATQKNSQTLFNNATCNDELYELYFRLCHLKSLDESSKEEIKLVFEDETGMVNSVKALKNIYIDLGIDGSNRKHQETMQKIRGNYIETLIQDRNQALALEKQVQREQEEIKQKEAEKKRKALAAKKAELEKKHKQRQSIEAQRMQTHKLLQIARSLKDRPAYQKWKKNNVESSDEAFLAHLIPVFEYFANSMGKEISTLETGDFMKLGDKISSYKTLFETYNEELKSQGLQLESTVGDGDCLFYSLVNSLCRLQVYPEKDDCNVTIPKRVSPSGEIQDVKVQAALHIRQRISEKILQNIEGILRFVHIYKNGEPDVPTDTGSGENFTNAIMTLFNLNSKEMQQSIYKVKTTSGVESKAETVDTIDIYNIDDLNETLILREAMNIYTNKIKYSANKNHFQYGIYSEDETPVAGIWGGSIEIMMASAIYNCNIQVHNAQVYFAAKNREIFSQGVRYNDTSETEFVIAHLGEYNKHYVSTIPVTATDTSKSITSDTTQSFTIPESKEKPTDDESLEIDTGDFELPEI